MDTLRSAPPAQPPAPGGAADPSTRDAARGPVASRARRAARILAILVAAHFLLAGAVLVAAAGPLAATLKAGPLVTQHWLVQTFDEARATAAVAGAALLLAGVLALLGRRAVERYILGVLSDAPRLAAGLGVAARDLLRRESRVHLVVLGAILAGAAGVRLVYLSQPLRYDEAYTCLIYACNHSIFFPLSAYYDPNNHVLHSLLVNLVWQVTAPFGRLPPWALRLPAFVAGVLTVPATYIWARLAFDKQAALLAAALVATSTILIEYATNARGYSLIGLFFLVLLILAWGLKRGNNRAGWFLFSIAGALGFLTIPTMLYPLGIVVLWLLLSVAVGDAGPGRRAVLLRLVTAVLVVGVLTAELYLPLLLVSGWRRLLANGYVASLPLNAAYVQQFRVNLLSGWLTWNRDLPGVVTWVEAIGVVVSLLAHRRIARDRVPLLVAIAGWALPALLAQRVLPLTRVWLFLLPVYLGLAAAGLVFLARLVWAHAPRRRAVRAAGAPAFAALVLLVAGGLAVGVIAAGSIYTDNPAGRSARAVNAFLTRTLRPGDAVVTQAPDNYIMLYYLWEQQTPLDPYFDWPGKYFDWRPQKRAFVVVTVGEYTLKAVLANVQFPTTRFSAPQVAGRFGASTIYKMDVLPAAP